MLAIILSVVIGLAVALVVVGFLLRREVTIECSVGIDRPAEAVFPWIADLKTWPEWTVWNKNEDPSLAYTYSGVAVGKGSMMSWTAKKMGNGSLSITDAAANHYIRYLLRMQNRTMVVHGNIEIESAGGGATLVQWFDSVDLGMNPFLRWMGMALKPMLRRAFHRNLAGLKSAVETGHASGPGKK